MPALNEFEQFVAQLLDFLAQVSSQAGHSGAIYYSVAEDAAGMFAGTVVGEAREKKAIVGFSPALFAAIKARDWDNFTEVVSELSITLGSFTYAPEIECFMVSTLSELLISKLFKARRSSNGDGFWSAYRNRFCELVASTYGRDKPPPKGVSRLGELIRLNFNPPP